ncbi:MAG TPA: hypothetical protein VHM02_01075 [Thermoanaerobaculia bacterium]|nr:hypothetical protein [Thermoanaerobaculia bacterium]
MLDRLAALLLACPLVLCAACSPADPSDMAGRVPERPAAEEDAADAPEVDEGEHEEEEVVELARPMAELHRFATKLGYAIAAGNQPLAGFYLDEVDEVLEEVGEIEESEGIPIARTAQVIVDPLRAPLRRAVEAGRWPEAQAAYEALIAGCNRCHAATAHEFLVVLPAHGDPPYAQEFAAE